MGVKNQQLLPAPLRDIFIIILGADVIESLKMRLKQRQLSDREKGKQQIGGRGNESQRWSVGKRSESEMQSLSPGCGTHQEYW